MEPADADEQSSNPAFGQFRADFDHLSSTEFEELCFELLHEMGFLNIDWRKGTPADSSPSDQGRDIQCEKTVTDVDGQVFTEKWFVDCKHYKTAAVPPDALSGTLAWADAERPQVVLFICSGWLSNPSKENLAKQGSFRSYRIKYWERKKIEGFLFRQGRTRLAAKYRLFSAGNTALMHPSHFYFVTRPRLYSAQHFLKVLQSVDPELREETIRMAFIWVFGMESRDPKFASETFGEMMTTPITLENLERAFEEHPINERFVIFGFLAQSLTYKFYAADTTDRDQLEERLKGMRDYAEEQSEQSLIQRKIARDLREQIDNLDQRYAEAYDSYVKFCQQVILPVIQEPEPELAPPPLYDLPEETADGL